MPPLKLLVVLLAPGLAFAGEQHPLSSLGRVDVETMRRIFADAAYLLPDDAHRGPPGYRLMRVLGRAMSWTDVRLDGDGYVVLGAHHRCDLLLVTDPGIWLRHLAAICVELTDGWVGLRLVDLQTDLPFFFDDDTPRWSAVAHGPFAIRLGRHVVCGFPIGEGARMDQDSGLIPATFVSQLGCTTAPRRVRLTLEHGGVGASIELPTEAFDGGVLVGRALTCLDGGLRHVFDEAIPRAHVLLLCDRGEVFAYDLCSTNGTRAAGERVRRHRLTGAEAALELGKKVTLRVGWPLGEASPVGPT